GMAPQLAVERLRPVMPPRRDERGQRLGVAPLGSRRDRGANGIGQGPCRRTIGRARDGEREPAVSQDLPCRVHVHNVSTMAEPRFDRARIERFLAAAATRLRGEWLIVGGAAAAAWFAPARTTEDVDMIGLGFSQDERFALMELATELGLPVEAVN